jgi:hypothetical protein
MDDASPTIGASRVNDEFEVGYNSRFEKRWYLAEQVGRLVMLTVVVAGLLGLLGRGPFSHRTHEAPGLLFAVDFEPIARWDTPTQVTLHLRPPVGADQVSVDFTTRLIEPMGMSEVWPKPLRSETTPDGLRMTFGVTQRPGDMLVRISGKPHAIGRVPLWAEIGGTRLDWGQFVLP